MKNILLVDDHSIIRQGLRNLIELEEGLQVTGEAASGIEALKLIRLNKYDIVVLDISMPFKNGVDTLNELKLRPSLTSQISRVLLVNTQQDKSVVSLDLVNSLYLIIQDFLYPYISTNISNNKQ